MTISFDGIQEKLNRAHENILNLESEIAVFFQQGEYPVLPEGDKQLLLAAIQYHTQRRIPLRFNVLAGEIIHHLRSCLDHMVWQFSSPQYRKDHLRQIEFPVFEKLPTDKNSSSRYEGKIKGIVSVNVRNLIEKLQPYNFPDPLDSPIFIIHHLDVTDKHRELVLSTSTGSIEIPTGLFLRYTAHQREHGGLVSSDLEDELERHSKVVPQISFTKFGRREIKPIVPGLKQLHNVTVEIASRFEAEIA
jgi:hypothetical protein